MLALNNVNKLYISSQDNDKNDLLNKYYSDVLLSKEDKVCKVVEYFFDLKKGQSEIQPVELSTHDEVLYSLLDDDIKDSIKKKLKEFEVEKDFKSEK